MSEKPSRTRFQVSLAGLLILITCFCVCCGLYQAITRRVKVKNATAKEANDARGLVPGPPLHFPESASRIDAEFSCIRYKVAFDIPESEFLTWCEDWPFELQRITLSGKSPVSFEVQGYEIDWPEDVKRMWFFSNMTHRGGWSVMYDLDRGRAYVNYAHH